MRFPEHPGRWICSVIAAALLSGHVGATAASAVPTPFPPDRDDAGVNPRIEQMISDQSAAQRAASDGDFYEPFIMKVSSRRVALGTPAVRTFTLGVGGTVKLKVASVRGKFVATLTPQTGRTRGTIWYRSTPIGAPTYAKKGNTPITANQRFLTRAYNGKTLVETSQTEAVIRIVYGR